MWVDANNLTNETKIINTVLKPLFWLNSFETFSIHDFVNLKVKQIWIKQWGYEGIQFVYRYTGTGIQFVHTSAMEYNFNTFDAEVLWLIDVLAFHHCFHNNLFREHYNSVYSHFLNNFLHKLTVIS